MEDGWLRPGLLNLYTDSSKIGVVAMWAKMSRIGTFISIQLWLPLSTP